MVCGSDALALHLVEELRRLDEDVIAVVPAALTKQVRGLGATAVESDRADGEAFRRARLTTARALALVYQDDVGNIHAALTAQDQNASLRLVVRMFNVALGERVRRLFEDCAVLSDSAITGPMFVAAALDRPTAGTTVAGRTLLIGRNDPGRVTNGHVLCGLADTTAPGGPKMLPDDIATADLVLTMADPSDVAPPRRRSPKMLLAALRVLVARRLRIALGALVALLAVGTVLFGILEGTWNAAPYITILTAAGAGDIDMDASAYEQILQVSVILIGVTIIPVFTAAVVDSIVSARLTYALGGLRTAMHDHVVVCGLGDVGSRIIEELHARGVRAVGVDRSEHSSGTLLAHRLRIPVITGDASREETLRAAQVENCRCLIAVTDDDVANLEVGLTGHGITPGLRIVLRLADGDLASMVERHLGITISRSVSALAAPAFAAAMLERRVLTTIPVGRRILVIAEIPVAPTSALEGKPVQVANMSGHSRVIGLIRRDDETYWTPHDNLMVYPGDRLLVLATRAGLSHTLLARAPSVSQPPTSDP